MRGRVLDAQCCRTGAVLRVRVDVHPGTIAVVVDRRELPIRRDVEQGSAVREAVPLR